ncbi:MAG: cysteine desulfurase [Lachnospiraceae bacterium]|nr:cysteine desulfurase [Lachnospiraceae bacterium]
MEAYLDNSATTQVSEEVAELTRKIMTEEYGNPSSKHRKGMEGENYIRYAKESLAKTLKCKEKELIFTSGGTESNNMALLGGALANRRRGKHIITTCFEHPSVHEPLIFLEEEGYEVTYLPVDSRGHISFEELEEALRQDTILVSVMYVNNEVGAVQDISGISRVIKGYNKDILFHVDAIQAYGKYRINPKKEGIDLMSVSGHKIHGPKGIGFLYVKEGTKIRPILFGGGQQAGMRSGTENVPGIAGLALAAENCYQGFAEKIDRLYELKVYFIQRINEIDGAFVNAVSTVALTGTDDEAIRETAPHIVSVSFTGVRSEVLLHALEERGVYVSSGSACSSNHPGISGTLTAIGIKQELLDSTLRFSFSVHTTKEQLDYAVEQLKELLPVLQKYTRH